MKDILRRFSLKTVNGTERYANPQHLREALHVQENERYLSSLANCSRDCVEARRKCPLPVRCLIV